MNQKASPLNGLLRYRSALERAAWFKLQGANAELARALELLQQLEREKVQLGRDRMEKLATGLSGAELMLECSSAIEHAITRATNSLAQSRLNSHAAQDEFRCCRREREVVENAIARQETRQQQKAERREQGRQDDATLRRISRQKQPSN